MIDKITLKQDLENFKDDLKHNKKPQTIMHDLVLYLLNNPVTADFYNKHVEEFNFYFRNYPRTIIKYSKETDDTLSQTYNNKEKEIIYNILEKRLHIFWAIDLDFKKQIEKYLKKGVRCRLFFKAFENSEAIIDWVDYIIKFGITPYSEDSRVKIALTETEKIILKYIHIGLSVPQIAKEMNISNFTIENHKKNICAKIDDLNMSEYKDKKALNKLQILSQNIFK